MKFDQKGLEAALEKISFMLAWEHTEPETIEEVLTAYLQETDSVIVPREPTEAMVRSTVKVRHGQKIPDAWAMTSTNAYRAMIQAAQEGE